MSRLRWKLLLAMIAVIVVTAGVSGLFTRRVTHEQVKRLLIAREPETSGGLIRAIEQHYRERGWNEIEKTTAQFRRPFVIIGVDRKVIATSSDLRGAGVRVDDDDRILMTKKDGNRLANMIVRIPPRTIRDARSQPIASVYVLPGDERRAIEFQEIAALDRRLIATFASALVVALLLTFFLSRRITSPLERLTAAAEEMGRGEVPARVAVAGNDEVAQLARSFNAMADSIARQEELRRRMVSDVAHELRTPLTNLRCELEAIQDGLTTPDKSRIASLHEEVLHLDRLVADLQELAVAEAGGMQLQVERVDLGDVVAHAVDPFRSQAERRHIALDVVRGSRSSVLGDSRRLGQVVRNLLTNAFQHTADGGRVAVTVSDDGSNAIVAVSDNGRGIPASEIDKIFERFYRVDESRARHNGGAGLGLAIVRAIIEQHRGSVWAENVEGGGAKFTFKIPLPS